MFRDRAENAGFDDLLVQSKITNRLLAAQLKATLGQQEMIRLLMDVGASNAEIGDVLGTTTATVATTIQRLKKKMRQNAPNDTDALSHQGADDVATS